jgi:hypothetical protein
MHDVHDRVRLVDASEIGGRGIQATVRRDEIQNVLGSKDGEPELVIDVTRGGEPQTLRLDWDPAELEQLLRQTEGDSIALTFDSSELERLLGEDVEAHGLREAAAVLAVAATTAVAGAGIAQAAGTVSEHEWPQAVPASTAAAPTSEQEWPQLVTGDAAPAAAAHTGFASEQEWPQAVPASTAAAPTSEQEWPQIVTGDAVPAPTPAAPVAVNTSDGSDVGTAAAVTGGAVLLISAAAFAVRRQHKVEPRPV